MYVVCNELHCRSTSGANSSAQLPETRPALFNAAMLHVMVLLFRTCMPKVLGSGHFPSGTMMCEPKTAIVMLPFEVLYLFQC